MVGCEYNHGFVIEASLTKNLNEATDSLINAGNALVVVTQFFAGFRGVRKKRGNWNLFGVIKYFFDSLVVLPVRLVSE